MSVSDNGLGMTQGQVERLFQAADHTSSGRGSGIGVKNVNERIRFILARDTALRSCRNRMKGPRLRRICRLFPIRK